ncbi:hypothetical protein B0T16DRAFT_400662 [Cercophora newfieldiana]|uniref:Rhodopsin domain-containing protein n=1 Tax=Cercophora newfieldiana TaxID=92897 RepID=A0AA40CZ57_9PEZI|nr:hypothetical protein B0T16DRAFT_400662 [Cercophora newfieldiana]
MSDSVVINEFGLPSNPGENDGPRILGATLAITILALITYLTRMYVRLVMVRNVGLDDYFMSFAMWLCVAGEGVIWGSIVNGAGRHLGDIPPNQISKGLKLNFISQPIFLIAICVTKLAVGATLLRIASTKFYRHLIIGIMAFMAFYTIGCFFTIVLQCTDIRALWDATIPQNCWSQPTLKGLSYTNVALNIITDLLLALVIPIPMLWNLNVNRRTRFSLIFALSLGAFACAAAFIKIPFLVNYGKTGDWLWDSRDISIWTVTECNTGIIAGSLPALRPIFKKILGTSLGYGKSSGKPAASGYFRQDTLQSNIRRKTMNESKTDECSSERAFNYYEMDTKAAGLGGAGAGAGAGGATFFAEVDARSSEESVNGGKTGGGAGATGGNGAGGGNYRTKTPHNAPGITKTTTTTVDYMSKDS